jgi:TonB family protein
MRAIHIAFLVCLAPHSRLMAQTTSTASDPPVPRVVQKLPRFKSIGTYYFPAGKLNHHARVLLQFVVDTSGRVDSTSIRVVSATDTTFDRAARLTLMTASFRPGESDGRRVPVFTQMALVFKPGNGHQCELNPLTTLLPPKCWAPLPGASE